MEKGERYLLNVLTCNTIGNYNQELLNNISDSLGLTYTTGSYSTVVFLVPKHADIFEVSQKVFETGGFSSVGINSQIPPIISHWGETNIHKFKEELTVREVQYYDMTGRRLETPSGLTIVITRYRDGSVRREKKLFR